MSKSNVHKKLMEARLRLQSKKLNKSGQNKFAGYNYFELGDFLPEVQNIFSELGLCGVVSFSADLATLTITDIEDGSSVVISSPMGSAALKGCHEVQNIGAVETYQRRYLWVTAMEIVEHDALDAVTGTERGEPERSRITPTSGAAERVPEPRRKEIDGMALQVSALLEVGQDFEAYEKKQSFDMDADETVYFWTKFNSKQRSTLKSIHDSVTRKAA